MPEGEPRAYREPVYKIIGEPQIIPVENKPAEILLHLNLEQTNDNAGNLGKAEVWLIHFPNREKAVETLQALLQKL